MARSKLELHPKVAAASVGGFVSTIAVWLLGLTGVTPPPSVTVAITGLIGTAFAYFAPWMAGDPTGEVTDQRVNQEAPVTSITRGSPSASAS